ncbi:hypothetical protein [Sphingomonas kyeonggiensis]|uniref:hypothetical protein n=1 Tax=Sphingomonas kyeonggiensis TaxID=1268553 RepID=UPI0027D87FE9|nr:hypothetical protein [Sphingomonas kyeonggiensis]
MLHLSFPVWHAARMTAEQMLEWTHPDGMHRVILERVAEDRFRYVVFELVQDEDFGSSYEYWRSDYPPSGLYASALDAQDDAANRLPWLRDLLDGMAAQP